MVPPSLADKLPTASHDAIVRGYRTLPLMLTLSKVPTNTSPWWVGCFATNYMGVAHQLVPIGSYKLLGHYGDSNRCGRSYKIFTSNHLYIWSGALGPRPPNQWIRSGPHSSTVKWREWAIACQIPRVHKPSKTFKNIYLSIYYNNTYLLWSSPTASQPLLSYPRKCI